MRAEIGPKIGQVIRHIPPSSATHRPLYLTFDDGPDPETTPDVLDLLQSEGVSASFFLVANRAAEHPELVREIVRSGHAIGNHSLDHRWGAFFRPRRVMLDWIVQSEQALVAITGAATIGFRSPAGVVTPPLRWALRELQMPLIHWNRRFYDAAWPLNADRLCRSLATTRSGDIVLFHDRQKVDRKAQFLSALRKYIVTARESGFDWCLLGRVI